MNGIEANSHQEMLDYDAWEKGVTSESRGANPIDPQEIYTTRGISAFFSSTNSVDESRGMNPIDPKVVYSISSEETAEESKLYAVARAVAQFITKVFTFIFLDLPLYVMSKLGSEWARDKMSDLAESIEKKGWGDWFYCPYSAAAFEKNTNEDSLLSYTELENGEQPAIEDPFRA